MLLDQLIPTLKVLHSLSAHRILTESERLGLEGTLKIFYFQPHAIGRDATYWILFTTKCFIPSLTPYLSPTLSSCFTDRQEEPLYFLHNRASSLLNFCKAAFPFFSFHFQPSRLSRRSEGCCCTPSFTVHHWPSSAPTYCTRCTSGQDIMFFWSHRKFHR